MNWRMVAAMVAIGLCVKSADKHQQAGRPVLLWANVALAAFFVAHLFALIAVSS